ncbi:hypothetical protein ACFLQV_03140 [Calditrichota bacterium]
MKLKEKIIIGFFLLGFAAASYGHYYSVRSPYSITEQTAFHRELLSIIDDAQLYYVKPALYGGSNRTFRALDFNKLGYTQSIGAITWQGQHGKYIISGSRPDSFDLVGTNAQGEQYEAFMTGYDTLPIIRRLN